MQGLADFLDGVVAALEHCLGILDDEIAYPVFRVFKNAQALCKGLQSRGIKFVSDGTDNHLMLVDLTPFGLTGQSIEKLLDAAHITANKNTIPNDLSLIHIFTLNYSRFTSRNTSESSFGIASASSPASS